MRVLITGGTGFIGTALCARLRERGHTLAVLSRRPARVPALCGAEVQALEDLAAVPVFAPEAVVNLSGAPIASRPWTRARRRLLRDSRIAFTRELVAVLARCAQPPQVMVSGSAVGYYGARGDEPLDEEADAVNDFPHQLCRDWEQAAQPVTALGTRLCLLRTGLVLGPGGMLARLLPAFRLGLGGPLGSGQQWMSWIHRDDLVALIDYLLAHQTLAGPFNGTAPNPVPNHEFTETLARLLKRPARLRLPAGLLRAALGDLATLLVDGQRALPDKALKAGFEFRYSQLDVALAEILRAPHSGP